MATLSDDRDQIIRDLEKAIAERDALAANEDVIKETQDLLAREGCPCDVMGHPKEGIARLIDQRDALAAENVSLAASQCHKGYGDDHGNWRCNYQDEIVRLAARLKEAVEAVRVDNLEIFDLSCKLKIATEALKVIKETERGHGGTTYYCREIYKAADTALKAVEESK